MLVRMRACASGAAFEVSGRQRFMHVMKLSVPPVLLYSAAMSFHALAMCLSLPERRAASSSRLRYFITRVRFPVSLFIIASAAAILKCRKLSSSPSATSSAFFMSMTASCRLRLSYMQSAACTRALALRLLSPSCMKYCALLLIYLPSFSFTPRSCTASVYTSS